MSDGLFILGGSSIYIPLLFEAFRKYRCFNYFDRITLHGRDQAKLAFDAAFGQNIAKKCGANTVIDFTPQLEDCLRDDYTIIFNQIRFGGMQARDLDEKCALKHQLFADETLGIVGVSNAIRTIAMIRPILEILTKKRSPFLFLNFTNPCSIVSQYALGHFNLNTIGICDYPNLFKGKLASFLGFESEKVQIGYFGLNHFAFIYDVFADGKPVFKKFKDQISLFDLGFPENKFFEYILLPSWETVFAQERIIRRQNKQYRKEGKNRAAILLELEKEFTDYLADFAFFKNREQGEPVIPPVLYKRNSEWYDIGLVPFFKAYFEGKNGIILNMDAGDVFKLGMKHCIVETSAGLQNRQPVWMGTTKEIEKHPEFYYLKLMKMAEKLLLEGILEKNGTKILESCLVNPMIQNLDRVRDYFRELVPNDQVLAQFLECKL